MKKWFASAAVLFVLFAGAGSAYASTAPNYIELPDFFEDAVSAPALA